MEHSTITPTPNGAGHEKSEVNVRTIIVSLAFLALGTFLVCMIVVGIFQYLQSTYTQKTAGPASFQLPPEPRIEVNPSVQIQDLLKHEDHVLDSYAWVNEQAGTVRVPISQAIDMLAQKGLPSHDYMADILAGRKPPMPPPPPPEAKPPAGGSAAQPQAGRNPGK